MERGKCTVMGELTSTCHVSLDFQIFPRSPRLSKRCSVPMLGQGFEPTWPTSSSLSPSLVVSFSLSLAEVTAVWLVCSWVSECGLFCVPFN